jgi:hypothetical protein
MNSLGAASPSPKDPPLLLELVWLVLLFESMEPRMDRPEPPLSCNGAARQFRANNKRTTQNTIKFFISLTLARLSRGIIK